MTDYKAEEDPYIEEVLATWGIRTGDAQLDWIKENAEKLFLYFCYKLEFVKRTDGKFGVIIHQFAARTRDNSRFITTCPNGERHAARELPRLEILDELPPDDVLYAPEPENHRFDNE